MKPSLRGAFRGAARIARGAAALAPLARRHVWGSVVARVGAAGAALVVLALIGARRPAQAEVAPETPGIATPAPVTPAPTAPTALTAPTATPLAMADAEAPHARASPDDPVVLNTATIADLRRLPGVGEKRAQAILALRTRLGRFRQIEDLLKVKGIGRATLKRLRPMLRVDPSADRDGG